MRCVRRDHTHIHTFIHTSLRIQKQCSLTMVLLKIVCINRDGSSAFTAWLIAKSTTIGESMTHTIAADEEELFYCISCCLLLLHRVKQELSMSIHTSTSTRTHKHTENVKFNIIPGCILR